MFADNIIGHSAQGAVTVFIITSPERSYKDYSHVVDQAKVPVRGDRQHADARAEPTVHEALAARLRIVVLGTIQCDVCLHALLPAQPLIMHIPSAFVFKDNCKDVLSI